MAGLAVSFSPLRISQMRYTEMVASWVIQLRLVLQLCLTIALLRCVEYRVPQTRTKQSGLAYCSVRISPKGANIDGLIARGAHRKCFESQIFES